MSRNHCELSDKLSIRYRITYKKSQALRYTANLDMHKIWERWMRRSNIPLAYSQGFHPQPRMNQAAPLPLGMLSDGEIIDIWVDESCSLDIFNNKLLSHSQPGIEIISITQISLRAPSIQTLVHHIVYHVIPIDQNLDDGARKSIDGLLDKKSIISIRRDKEYDLRPLIIHLSLETEGAPGNTFIKMILLSLPAKTGRPDEVINALGYSPSDFRYIRKEVILSESDPE